MASKRRYVTEGYEHRPGQPWLLVMVDWEDAATQSAWTGHDEIMETHRCKLVGFLRSRLADGLVVVANFSEDSQMSGQFRVPAGMVAEVEVIKEVKDLYEEE